MKFKNFLLFCFFILSSFFGPVTNLSSTESVKFCAPAAVGSAMICLEYVAYAHPVLAVVGSSIGLAEVAYHALLKHVRSAMSVSEAYFAKRGISTAAFKNQIKATFQKNHSHKKAQALQKAKDTQSTMNTPGGPNDPKKPKDDDKDADDEKVKTADMPEN